MGVLPFSFKHPVLLAGAALIAIGAILVHRRRRPAVARLTSAFALLGMILFMLAAGGLEWHRAATAEVAVMVDLSASTRTALYRRPEQLQARIKQLLGGAPYRLIYFSDRNVPDVSPGATLPDLPSDSTIYSPPGAIAVLLFSDARFELPATAPPTFIVADPNLDNVHDASVTRLEMRHNEIAATVYVAGKSRQLTLAGAATRPTQKIDPGNIVITRPVRPNADSASALVDKADPWPENDGLVIPLAPPMRAQRWLITNARTAPSEHWKVLTPAQLSGNSADYLTPAVIVLDNLAAGDLSPEQQRLLAQYVRDLNGGLVIAGGNRAFSAGMYPGSLLETLSPLASAPPKPAIHWMLLADCSGSMSQAVAGSGQTRWGLASNAAIGVLRVLPPRDTVSIGAFAGDLNWWSTGKAAENTAAMLLPPAGTSPSGPTNLGPALERIARESDGSLVSHLLVVSDTDTTINDPDGLARRLAQKKIHLHVLAISEGAAAEALSRITRATGGAMRTQIADPTAWADEIRQMLAAAWPKRLIHAATQVQFIGELASLPARDAAPWNRTWLKKNAASAARTTHESQEISLAARWTLGGDVIACAFSPSTRELEALADRVARPPRDPRFTVTWDAGSKLIVRVEAAESNKPINQKRFRLEIAPTGGGRGTIHRLNQTAPGRYELSIPSPREASFATVFLENQLIDRIAAPARYPPEFDAIGNDFDAMRTLAARTGGAVIDRAWTKPLRIAFPEQKTSLAPTLSLLGSLLLAAALWRWRWG